MSCAAASCPDCWTSAGLPRTGSPPHWRSSRAILSPRPHSRWPCWTRTPRLGGVLGYHLGRSVSRCPVASWSASTTASPHCSTPSPHISMPYICGRIKLKIEPGWDIEPVRAVRERFGPDLPLQVDANTAYTVADAPHLARLDPFDLVSHRAAACRGRSAWSRGPRHPDPHADLGGRFHHLRVRSGRHLARRLPGGERQARPGRWVPGRPAGCTTYAPPTAYRWSTAECRRHR